METPEEKVIFFPRKLFYLIIRLHDIRISNRFFTAEKTTIKFMNPFTPSGGWAMFWSCQDRLGPTKVSLARSWTGKEADQ